MHLKWDNMQEKQTGHWIALTMFRDWLLQRQLQRKSRPKRKSVSIQC
jgi:hypothetical protein